MAREVIGTMHIEAINPARRGNIASALKAWSDERRATIADLMKGRVQQLCG
jgi:hypothetical protein